MLLTVSDIVELTVYVNFALANLNLICVLILINCQVPGKLLALCVLPRWLVQNNMNPWCLAGCLIATVTALLFADRCFLLLC